MAAARLSAAATAAFKWIRGARPAPQACASWQCWRRVADGTRHLNAGACGVAPEAIDSLQGVRTPLPAEALPEEGPNPVRFYPPGAGATTGRVEKFIRLVSKSLENGLEVELEAGGKFAALQSLRALAASPGGAEFQVSWAEVAPQRHGSEGDQQSEEPAVGPTPSSSSGSRPQRWHLLARRCGTAGNGSAAFAGCLVTASTPAERLARRLSLELARTGVAVAHLRADGPAGAGTLLAALATTPSLGTGDHLVCNVTALPADKEAGISEHLAVLAQETAASLRKGDFRAFPLGSGTGAVDPPGPAQVRLARSVDQRLARGHAVVMECRGKDAVLSALAALGRVQGCTAEVEVHWVDDGNSASSSGGDATSSSIPSSSTPSTHSSSRSSSSRSSSSSGQTAEAMRTLRLRALPGRRWPEFNATDFSTTRLLKVAATTQARPLAAAVGSEVRRLGAASVHAFMDDKVAVSTALKALALVPQEHGGQRVFFVPSFGHVKRGSTLRLHVQPLARRSTLPPAAAEGSALGPEPGPTGGAVEGELD